MSSDRFGTTDSFALCPCPFCEGERVRFELAGGDQARAWCDACGLDRGSIAHLKAAVQSAMRQELGDLFAPGRAKGPKGLN